MTSARRWTGSPSSPTNYLDFRRAELELEAAREEAVATSHPRRVPPVRLADCVRNEIESALAAPRASFLGTDLHPDLCSKAAALTYSLARSQACSDGNKRIALILLTVFVRMNGYRLVASNQEAADTVLRVATSDRLNHEEEHRALTEWLREKLEPEDVR